MDLLSSMPDDVLHHILSFLSTEEAGATSLLSTRWRHLWKIHPRIHINLYCDHRYYEDDDDPDLIHHIEANVSWVDSLLSSVGHHPLSLPEFSIQNHGYVHNQFGQHIERWISFALQNDVVVLNLGELPFTRYEPSYHFPPPYPLCLPNKTRNLMHLSLNNCVLRPTFEGFSNLKSLSLFDAFVSDAAFESINLNCRKLEVLVLRYVKGLQNITISTSLYNLKHLEISNCFLLEHLSIESPNLTTLKYHGAHGQNQIQPSSILRQAPRLREVSLSLCGEEGTFSNTVALLRGDHTSVIGRIEKLTMDLARNLDRMDVCSNLSLLKDIKELSLSISGSNLITGLDAILRGCTRLESLSLAVWPSLEDSEALPWRRDEQWKHKRLRKIKINKFYLGEHEFQALEYLVETSLALEEVAIVPSVGIARSYVEAKMNSRGIFDISNKLQSGAKLKILPSYEAEWF